MFFQKPGYNYAGLVGFPCRVFQPPYKLGKSFMTTHHYVYHSYEEWGREYIGIRSCDCLPEEDTKYFGSFKDKTFKPTEKTILFVCETREEVLEIEIELHDFFDVAVNHQFANRAKQASTGFDRAGLMFGEKNPMFGLFGEKHPLFGVPRTEETKKKLSVANSGEKNPNYGVPCTEEIKKKISEANSGKTHTEETKKKLSVAKSGEKHPRFGLFGALNPTSKAVIAIEPDGTQRHYGGGREAARELKMNSGSLCIYLNEGHVLTRGPYKNWRFVFDLTPVYENK